MDSIWAEAPSKNLDRAAQGYAAQGICLEKVFKTQCYFGHDLHHLYRTNQKETGTNI